MTVIEIGLVGVKPNYQVMNPSTSEGQILNKAWSAVTIAPNGPHWVYGGLEIDSPLRLWGFFAFDSIAHHQEFAKTGGAEAVKDLPKVLTHSVFQKHVAFDGDLTDVLRVGVVEVRFMYFLSDIPVAKKDAVSTIVRRRVNETLVTCADVGAVSIGWSMENDFPVLHQGEPGGREGTVLSIFMGWSSVEAQKKFREEQGERDELESFGEMSEMSGSFTVLIDCRQFGKARKWLGHVTINTAPVQQSIHSLDAKGYLPT